MTRRHTETSLYLYLITILTWLLSCPRTPIHDFN